MGPRNHGKFDFCTVLDWMGMVQNNSFGNDLDGNDTLEFSQKRPKSQLPWFYRGKSTAGIFPKRALNFFMTENVERHAFSSLQRGLKISKALFGTVFLCWDRVPR